MARCFVAGATGYVGREVVRMVAPRWPTVAHVRPDSSRLGEWRQRFTAFGASVDACPWQVDELRAAIDRHQASHVFSLIGTTRSRARAEAIDGDRYRTIDLGLTMLLLEAARTAAQPPRFIYLSSIGADPAARGSYLKVRGEAEAAIRDSGLSYLIARPSFVTGADREEGRPGERIAAALTDGAVAAMALLGARGLRARYRSMTGAELAAGLVARGVDGNADEIVLGDALRA